MVFREGQTSVMRRIVWLGDTRRNIQAFPAGAQKLIGDELQLVQFGGMPKDAKPFKGIGSGVFEIALARGQCLFLCLFKPPDKFWIIGVPLKCVPRNARCFEAA